MNRKAQSLGACLAVSVGLFACDGEPTPGPLDAHAGAAPVTTTDQADERELRADGGGGPYAGDARQVAAPGQPAPAQPDGGSARTNDELPDPGLALFEPSVFKAPSLSYAPGLRWAWPGGAVEDDTIAAQVELFAQAGYGSVEPQPMTLALSAEQVAADPRIRTVGQEPFFAHVRALARAVHEHGMEYDLTLGSGWPNGGPGVPAEAAEQQILYARADVTGPAEIDLALPPPAEPSWVAEANNLLPDVRITAEFDPMAALEGVVAAALIDARADPPVLGTPVDVSAQVSNGHLRWSVPEGPHAVFALYRNRTARIVLKAAFPGAERDARVIDHLDARGARWLLSQQVETWVEALGGDRPKNFFVDSFELTGELPWSAGLAERYRARVGHLPYADMLFFFRAGSETMYVEKLRTSSPPAFATQDAQHALRVREDYESVRAQAFSEEFLRPLAAGLHAHGVGLRLQAHGGWGFVLDDYAVADVPESEGLYAGGSFDFLNLAASAAHVAGQRQVSTESFTTLNLLSGADLLDENTLWLLSGLAYTAGINRLVHSWAAYPYTTADGEAWHTHDTDPSVPGSYTAKIEPGAKEWAFLPQLNRAQARIGYALSRGTPRVDLAWLKTARDHRDLIQLAIGSLNVNAAESSQSSALRADGYTYDRVSPNALATAKSEAGTLKVGAASYRALLIDSAAAIDPAVLEAIDAAASAGVAVVWVGGGPTRATGSFAAAARDARVAEVWSSLRARIQEVDSAAAVSAALRKAGTLPDVEPDAALGTIGIQQRQTDSGRVIWLFNESILPQAFTATLRIEAASALWLDPATGDATSLVLGSGENGRTVSLSLPGLRGAILYLPR